MPRSRPCHRSPPVHGGSTQDFRAVVGELFRFRFPEGTEVRVDSAIEESAVISPYYDSLLAKVIAYAPTRAEAARRLSRALARRTSTVSARIANCWLARWNIPISWRSLRYSFSDSARSSRIGATVGGRACCSPARRGCGPGLAGRAAGAKPRCWEAHPRDGETIPRSFSRFIFAVIKRKSPSSTASSATVLRLRVDGEDQRDLNCTAATPERVRISADGIERNYAVHRVGETFYVDSPLGASVLVELPRFPVPKKELPAGSLMAPLPGVVNEVKAMKGDTVAAGDVVLVIESMKVFHWIAAPLAGRITEIRVEPGSHVESGAVLAVIETAS